MAPSTTRSLLYVATGDPDRVADALCADAKTRGYRRLDALPNPSYPRQPLEVREWAVLPVGDAEWTIVAPEERDRIFHWGRDASAALRGVLVVALTVDPWGDWQAKSYLDGRPVAKLSDDTDDEFLYPVSRAGEREIQDMERALGWDRLKDHPFRAWARQFIAGEAKSATSLARALGVPRPDRSWPELAGDPAARTERWARADSPLHDW